MGKTKNVISIYQEDGEGKGKYLSIEEAKKLFGGGGGQDIIAVDDVQALVGKEVDIVKGAQFYIEGVLHKIVRIEKHSQYDFDYAYFGNSINKVQYQATVLHSDNTIAGINEISVPVIVQTYAVPENGGQVLTTQGYNMKTGTDIQFTASPKTGYHFVRWSDGNTQSTRYIRLKDNTSIVAYFEED